MSRVVAVPASWYSYSRVVMSEMRRKVSNQASTREYDCLLALCWRDLSRGDYQDERVKAVGLSRGEYPGAKISSQPAGSAEEITGGDDPMLLNSSCIFHDASCLGLADPLGDDAFSTTSFCSLVSTFFARSSTGTTTDGLRDDDDCRLLMATYQPARNAYVTRHSASLSPDPPSPPSPLPSTPRWTTRQTRPTMRAPPRSPTPGS